MYSDLAAYATALTSKASDPNEGLIYPDVILHLRCAKGDCRLQHQTVVAAAEFKTLAHFTQLHDKFLEKKHTQQLRNIKVALEKPGEVIAGDIPVSNCPI